MTPTKRSVYSQYVTAVLSFWAFFFHGVGDVLDGVADRSKEIE